HEHDVGLVVGDLGERVEAVDGREHFAALLGQKGFGSPADGLAVVDHQDFQSRQLWLAVDRALHESAPWAPFGYACVGAGILWLFNISGPCKPRYGVDISGYGEPNNGGVVHSFLKRVHALPARAGVR